MQKSDPYREGEALFGADSEDLRSNVHLAHLQDALRSMVAGESRLVRPQHLTDQIVLAVRPSERRITTFDDLWSGLLVSWFRPVMIVGMLLIGLLAVYNVTQGRQGVLERSTTERMLGLHNVTVVSLYDSDLASISK